MKEKEVMRLTEIREAKKRGMILVQDIHKNDIHASQRSLIVGRILRPSYPGTIKDSTAYPGWKEGYFCTEDGGQGWYFFGIKYEDV